MAIVLLCLQAEGQAGHGISVGGRGESPLCSNAVSSVCLAWGIITSMAFPSTGMQSADFDDRVYADLVDILEHGGTHVPDL